MEQVLYKLPEGWEWTNLSDVCTPSRKTVEPNPEEQYNYIGLENIESHTGRVISNSPTKGSEISSTKVSFKQGMVLYGKLRPYLNKVIVAKVDGIATTEIIPFKCSDAISPGFLAYYLRSQYFVDLAMNNCSGARMPRATTKLFTQIAKVPVTSIIEQKRIVAKLDTLFTSIDTAIKHLQESVTLADALSQNGLDSYFAELTKTTPELPLLKLAEFISGYAFKSGDFTSESGIKSIKITNVGVNEFTENIGEFLPANYESEYQRFAAKTNDIVIALTRPIINGGLKVCRVPETYSGALVNQRVAAITSHNKHVLDFIYLYLQSSRTKNYVQEKSKSLNQPNLSITDLKNLTIPLPNHDDAIVKAVSDCNALISKTRKSKAEILEKISLLNRLKTSILDSAFKGEL
ncbi:restriction endonuclease subunit S [Providencia rettgeri]|uniref:restriction endonuclease subunit S n=1 Tax=Providencia rettgeri TaxID=587 RepID=UPI001419C21D|nr:restriction endonuclease subunit S [Providencia rettgeri]NIH06195.1 hypothetical protein [Providencia rettgeri]